MSTRLIVKKIGYPLRLFTNCFGAIENCFALDIFRIRVKIHDI